MSRGHSQNIRPEVKQAILQVKVDNFAWSAVQVRNHLLRNYAKYRITQEQIPQKRAIQKIIQEKYDNIDDFLKRPDQQLWHLGSPINDGLSAETLPILLSLQQLKRQAKQFFSVREARWAARLTPILKSFSYQDSNLMDALEFWVEEYATREKIMELINVKNPSELIKVGKQLFYPEGGLDTSDLDQDLFDCRGNYQQSKIWQREKVLSFVQPGKANDSETGLQVELTPINNLKETTKEEKS